MKRLLLSSAAALLATSAFGADLRPAPVLKAPAVQSSPAYDWSGFYAGINAGGGWGSNETTANSATADKYTVDLAGVAVGTNPVSGLIAGGQVGYNYQFYVPIVVGIEADADWSGIKGSGPCATSVLVGCSETDKLKWTADVAARLGYAFGGFLPYFKGGVVWGDFSHDFRVPVGNINTGADFVTGSSDNVRTGFLVGAGLEYAVSQHLTAKLEYNFLDFGSKASDVAFTGPSLGNTAVSVNGSFKDQVSVFKGGLNYKF